MADPIVTEALRQIANGRAWVRVAIFACMGCRRRRREPEKSIHMRKLKAFVHRTLNARYARYPSLMHMLFYPPRLPLRRLEKACPLSDAFLGRMCAAFRASPKPASVDIWTGLNTRAHSFQKALADADIAGLRAHLSDLFGMDSPLSGMAHTARNLEAFGSYSANHVSIRCRDALLSLAEALAVRGIMSNVQTPLKKYISVTNSDLEPVLAEVERALGHALAPPRLGGPPVAACGEALLNPDSIRHAYVMHRVEQIGVRKDAAILEIGGGFATVARYAHMRGFRDYTIIDLPYVNALQAAFLASELGEANVRLFGEHTAAPLRLLPSTAPGALAEKYDLVLNMDSLPEIDDAATYVRIIRNRAKLFLSINQEAANASSGFTQHIVAKLVENEGGFRRLSRHLYWMEQGYAEELYAVES